MTATAKEEIKPTMIRLPRSLWLKIKIKNLETGDNLNNLIIKLLTEYAEKSAK